MRGWCSSFSLEDRTEGMKRGDDQYLKINKYHIWEETLRNDSIEMQQLFTD
jgi:hypothetical protein